MELGAIEQQLIFPHRFHIKLFASIDSTNKYLYEHGEKLPDWSVVVAEEQTAGRGRYHRSWISPPQTGLWFSLLLRPSIDIRFLNLVNLFTAYSLAQYLENRVSFEIGRKIHIGLKWPNDLLVDSKKLSGILLEGNFAAQQLRYIVVGIGLNVNQAEDDFPPEIRPRAISLRMATGSQWNREKLLGGFLNFFYDRYHDVFSGDYHQVIDLYLQKALFRNESISVHRGADTIQGIFEGLTPEGYLILNTPEGKEIILTGDVV